jgi:hypothetical protein
VECDIEPVDAVHLLQASVVLHAAATHNTNVSIEQRDSTSESTSGYEWFDWRAKFPAFAKPLKQTRHLTPPNEASEFIADETAEATTSDFVKAWGHLDDNMWMQTVDGKFHVNGSHAMDGSQISTKGNFDGNFSGASLQQYRRFLNESQWNTRWTADRFAEANAGFAGDPGKVCNGASCDELYMKEQEFYPGEALSKEDRNESHTRARIRDDLNLIFADYYRLVTPLHKVNLSLRLQFALPILSHFYLKLAYTHPFFDGNTRVRVLFLNTELVRLGGHPVMLWDFRESQGICWAWWSYNLTFYDSCVNNSLPKMQNQILEGWCAWEAAAVTGASPFQSGERRKTFDDATATCV